MADVEFKTDNEFFCGEDLLKVFGYFDIQLLNLRPNVIKAWFDTDDKHMRDLLCWMCSSLSAKNYLPPLENAEFLELACPLFDQKYEDETKRIKTLHPGIFDAEENSQEIEYLQDELELLLEEEKELNIILAQNEALQADLSHELTETTSKQIKASVVCKRAQEECETLSKKSDEMNKELYKYLTRYGSILNDFHFGSASSFINSLDIEGIQMTYNIPQMAIGDKSFQDISHNLSNSNTSKVGILRNRIWHAEQNYLSNKYEIEKLIETQNYFINFNIDDVIYGKDSLFMDARIHSKEETKKRMCATIDNICSKQADDHVAQIKLRYAQEELQTQQIKSQSFSKLLELVKRLLLYYFLISILHLEEQKDLSTCEDFFNKMLVYIVKVQKGKERITKMRKIIDAYEASKNQPQFETFKLIRIITGILSDNNNTPISLSKALEIVSEFKNELNSVEQDLFCKTFYGHLKSADLILKDVKTLQSFLMSGPTQRLILVPSILQNTLTQVEEHLKNESESVKAVVSESSTMKKLGKWENYRRQLWMYFVTNPSKVTMLLKLIEDEVNRKLAAKE